MRRPQRLPSPRPAHLAVGALVAVAAASPAASSGQAASDPTGAATTTPTTTTAAPAEPQPNRPPKQPEQPTDTPHHEQPAAHGGRPQHHSGSHRPAPATHRDHKRNPKRRKKHHTAHRRERKHHRAPAPPPPEIAPGPFASLPGPEMPSLAIDRFRIPIFLLPIYRAAEVQYGVRWEVLAAINEIETDYGRNVDVSSAGAVGWMQFMPATWRLWGVDGNHDGRRDPYNPVDAIFSAARYLRAAGADTDLRGAIFAYNHAGWYVDSVLLRARLIAGYPPELMAALTGLTDGRFPVAAPSRYARRPGRGGKLILTRRHAPVVAVQDGVVRRIGWSRARGRFVVLRDVYGNSYTYSQLGSVAHLLPVPRVRDPRAPRPARPLVGPLASALVRRLTGSAPELASTDAAPAAPATAATPASSTGSAGGIDRTRLFAHPERPAARRHGGLEQILRGPGAPGFERYSHLFAPALGLDARHATLRRLRPGARVVRGTVLGRVGRVARIRFELRPAGRGAPEIDPTPVLDGWRLLESTAIYRAASLRPGSPFSIGQVLLLPKQVLERRVLADRRIGIYPGGRADIRSGQIDRRVLATLEYLADSGLDPTVSCLRSGHSYLTASGNVSEHSSGNAVDIAAINGVPILGHQQPGGIAEETVRRLMLLQGEMQPHQIISLLDLGANTLALPDHANHIHVGFRPPFGPNMGADEYSASILAPRQWTALARRLGAIDQPGVRTRPSRWTLP